MQPALLLLLQALTGTAIDDFDLRKVPPPNCGDPGPAIIVCGRRRSQRLEPLPGPKDEPLLPRAQARLFGNVTGSIDVTAKVFPDGQVSNRAMLTLKLPF